MKKVLSVTKQGFVFWAQRKPNAKLEIFKAFQNSLTGFLRFIENIGISIYWEYRTAGHLVL